MDTNTKQLHSVLVNGNSFEFVHSLRGLKQRDPLFLTLFIIPAEVLSRSLNRLNEDNEFIDFKLSKWSEKINHSSYADITILFCPGHKGSVKKMMKVLQKYEKVSDQLINLSKNFIYLHERVLVANKQILRRLTNIAI